MWSYEAPSKRTPAARSATLYQNTPTLASVRIAGCRSVQNSQQALLRKGERPTTPDDNVIEDPDIQ